MFHYQPVQSRTVLTAKNISRMFATNQGCQNVNFELAEGQVLAIVGESGSGKSTLLNTLSGRVKPDQGTVWFTQQNDHQVSLYDIPEAQRRSLLRTELGFVHQNPRDGIRLRVSAGGNIAERLMALGNNHYGDLRQNALNWLEHVEIDQARTDDQPRHFSGGMQQRLQIARTLVTSPRLVFMDEPTGGLDVSVQARILDLIRNLVQEFQLSVVIVTHDLAVARLLSHRMLVMKNSVVVESGLTDQILDDPQHPYTQLLVSSILS